MNKSQLEEAFFSLWKEKGLPESDIVPQYRLVQERLWKYDFAFPSQKLLIEIQGMGRGGSRGGHQTAQGMRNDCDKHNTAVLLGWRILTFSSANTNVEEWVYQTCQALCYPQGVNW